MVKQAVQDIFQNNSGTIDLLLLDFSQTTFIDSSGIGALVNCRKLTEAHHTHLRLINVPTQVRLVLSLTNLDEVFDIEVPTAETPSKGHKGQSSEAIITHPSMNSKAKR